MEHSVVQAACGLPLAIDAGLLAQLILADDLSTSSARQQAVFYRFQFYTCGPSYLPGQASSMGKGNCRLTTEPAVSILVGSSM